MYKHTTTDNPYTTKLIPIPLSEEHLNSWNKDKKEIENDIGLKAGHPFIASYDYVFWGKKNLYLCHPYFRGGDLFTNL